MKEKRPVFTKYLPLQVYLEERPNEELRLTFEHIEVIIQGELPSTAYSGKAFWNNIAGPGHPQATAWRNAGWEVKTVDLKKQLIFFRRLKTK